MNMLLVLYWICIVILAIFSYGFIDLNLHLSNNPLFLWLQGPLSTLVFHMRPATAAVYFMIVCVLFAGFIQFLRYPVKYFPTWKSLVQMLIGVSFLLLISFPAFTYDIFNYITTAKVTFTHKENPYVVMPIEIPNEPYLAFTRAANKFALYGPVWIGMTFIPHLLGAGNIWQTIIAFKLMNVVGYFLFIYLIYRFTRSMKNVIFFAFNPLVLIEALVSGHNDIFMMLFALGGLIFWRKQGLIYKSLGIFAMVSSWFIKGATLVLAPFLFIKKLSLEQALIYAYWIMAGVFFIVAPMREELYPWYAVWLISIASLLPVAKHQRIWEFTIVLSLALELRHIPYMYMGYYGGPGPMLRIAVTIVPVIAYFLWLLFTKKISLWHIKKR